MNECKLPQALNVKYGGGEPSLSFGPLRDDHKAFLKRRLRLIVREDELACVLVSFIHYNSHFAGAAAVLAGTVACRTDLFRDRSVASEVLQDRSTEIAASIMEAVYDEFGDPGTLSSMSHRELGRRLHQHVQQVCDAQEPRRVRSHLDFESTWKTVEAAYGVGRVLSERELYRALGFHMGSEWHADLEFNALKDLVSRFPRAAEMLERVDSVSGVPEAYWLGVHGEIEEVHWGHAVRAVELAVTWGSLDQVEGEQLVLEGFAQVHKMSHQVFDRLVSFCGSSGDGDMSGIVA